jgi:hypothetical protein
VHAYLADRDGPCTPLVVPGDPGCGKSTLLARAIEHDARPDGVYVVRFCGATPGSRRLAAVLESITAQVERIYKSEQTVSAGCVLGKRSPCCMFDFCTKGEREGHKP